MNIALIKHDGAALNLPANYIQAIVPNGMETTEICDYTDHNKKELERAVSNA